MKIAIITMVGNNYGNRLQNYALQEALKRIGAQTETLHNPWQESYNEFLYRIKFCIRRVLALVNWKRENVVREIKFKKFNQQYVRFSKLWLNNEKDRKKAANLYDLFLCGSDQVWNSDAKEINGKYFASFAPDEKKASYAASFGTDNIVEGRKEEFRNYLGGFSYISVRENSGVKIVNELINRKAEQHMDPTVLLKSEDWEKIEKKPEKICLKDDYLIAYVLGDHNSVMEEVVVKVAQKYSLKIIRLSEMGNLSSNVESVGPDEFIFLIHHAKCVITDSFHGTVFSILFHTPFFVFNRNGRGYEMSTRLESLLKIVGLEERFHPSKEECLLEKKIDFHMVDDVLELERKRSFEYLNEIVYNNEKRRSV